MLWPWNGFGLPTEPTKSEPVQTPKPTPKIPFDIGNVSPLTTREMCILHDYVKYLQRIYYHDNQAGYVEGMLEYLAARLATNIGMNRFAAGDVFIKEENPQSS